MKYLLTIIIFFNTVMALKAQDNLDIDERAILEMRLQSNQAIKAHQIDEALTYLTEDINISASNSKILSGKMAFKDALTNTFSKSPDLYFVRNSDEVLLNNEKTVGWEKGTWEALRPQTADWTNYGGSYSAFWVKKDGIWKIRSELFVRLY